MFLRGCSDRQDLVFCLFWIKKASLALRIESRLEKIFSMGINCMSLAVWLEEDRKCSAAAVGLDLVLGLFMVSRPILPSSFAGSVALSRFPVSLQQVSLLAG